MAAACKGLREGLITSSVVAQLPCGEGRRLEAEGELLCGWDCRDGAVLCWKGWVRKSYILGLVGLCLGLLLLQWPLGDSTQGSWSLWCWGKAPGTVPFAHSDRELRLIKSSGALSHPWEQLHGPCLEVLCNLGDFFFLSWLKQDDFYCAAVCWMGWQLPAECRAGLGALRCVTYVKQLLLKEVLWGSCMWLVGTRGQIHADWPWLDIRTAGCVESHQGWKIHHG